MRSPIHRWLAFELDHDRANGPFGVAALDHARPALGERVIDVGCGCGATSLALAEAVGPGGHVLGIDVSATLLARARRRAAALLNVQFLEQDAQTGSLMPNRNLVFSRFGVMFFGDPLAAFRNLEPLAAPALLRGPRDAPRGAGAARSGTESVRVRRS